jgi:hypothetical protein
MAREGMHIADESYRALGRIAAVPSSTALDLAEGAAIDLEALPDADGDGRGRLWMLDLAPGDLITLPSRADVGTAG